MYFWETVEYPMCAVNEWQCDNEECIPEAKHCDLVNDCSDGSDEGTGCGNVFLEYSD